MYIFAHPSRAKEPCSRGVRRAAKRRWTKKSPATNVLKRNQRTHRHTRQHYGILKLDACVCVCVFANISNSCAVVPGDAKMSRQKGARFLGNQVQWKGKEGGLQGHPFFPGAWILYSFCLMIFVVNRFFSITIIIFLNFRFYESFCSQYKFLFYAK